MDKRIKTLCYFFAASKPRVPAPRSSIPLTRLTRLCSNAEAGRSLPRLRRCSGSGGLSRGILTLLPKPDPGFHGIRNGMRGKEEIQGQKFHRSWQTGSCPPGKP